MKKKKEKNITGLYLLFVIVFLFLWFVLES